MTLHRYPLMVVSMALALSGCAAELGEEDDFFAEEDCMEGLCDSNRSQAICSVRVRNRGTFNVEETYLPRVIACENGDAPDAALRAQAIAARTYMYYRVANGSSIRDGQSDQVFTCGRQPSQRHYDAVRATSGQFLKHNTRTLAAFYVAGAYRTGSSCGRGSDPTRTERFVTDNHGRAGSSVRGSTLGYLGNPHNRGAMSQHWANCLARKDYSTEEILEYFYGTDVVIAQATGSCVADNVPAVTDVGEFCTQDSDCEDHCEVTIDPVAGVTGFCSAECINGCPSGSACVELGDEGEKACAPLTHSSNDTCEEITGTEPAVLDTQSGWKSVCVAPAYGTTCSPPSGAPGECIDTNVETCGGTLHTNLCPGGNSIRCCEE